MNIPVLVITISIMIIYMYFRSDKRTKKEVILDLDLAEISEKEDISAEGLESRLDMEQEFFEIINDSSEAYKISSIFSQYDELIIKMLFQVNQIPYYIELENMSRYRFGIPIYGYNNSILNILKSDYADAISVLESYSRSKKSMKVRRSGRIRNIVEAVIAGWCVQSPSDDTLMIHYEPGFAARS